MKVVVVDVGTSSMRGILYDENGESLFIHQVPYHVTCISDELIEQPPSDWEDALYDILGRTMAFCRDAGISLDAISLTSQRSSVIPVDREGRPLRNAIMWQDKRTKEICGRLKEQEDLIAKKTGVRVNNVFSGCKMQWIKEQEPEVYEKAHKILTIADYLVFLMTGEFHTDHTYGSRSMLMNMRTLQWDEELLGIFGIDREKLCDFVAPGDITGYTTALLQEKTGVPAGTPLISAGGDQQCAALGQGVVSQGILEVTVGTGAFILACNEGVPDHLQSDVICGVSAMRGRYNLESSILTCCSAYDWFRDNFYDHDLKKMNQEIEQVPAGAGGCIALPYFQGRGTPDWNSHATALFANVTLSTTRGHMARALLEGIAYEVAENIAVIEKYTGPAKTIHIGGGLTNFPLYNQMQADICGKPVVRYDDSESTALGAWISAMVTLGSFGSYEDGVRSVRTGASYKEFVPSGAAHEQYREMHGKVKELYGRLYETGSGTKHALT